MNNNMFDVEGVNTPEQIESLKLMHLSELMNQLVKNDGYAEYLISSPLLYKRVLELVNYGLVIYTESEAYEECALLVSVKNEILKKKENI